MNAARDCITLYCVLRLFVTGLGKGEEEEGERRRRGEARGEEGKGKVLKGGMVYPVLGCRYPRIYLFPFIRFPLLSIHIDTYPIRGKQ